jgi:hypothetical protein
VRAGASARRPALKRALNKPGRMVQAALGISLRARSRRRAFPGWTRARPRCSRSGAADHERSAARKGGDRRSCGAVSHASNGAVPGARFALLRGQRSARPSWLRLHDASSCSSAGTAPSATRRREKRARARIEAPAKGESCRQQQLPATDGRPHRLGVVGVRTRPIGSRLDRPSGSGSARPSGSARARPRRSRPNRRGNVTVRRAP